MDGFQFYIGRVSLFGQSYLLTLPNPDPHCTQAASHQPNLSQVPQILLLLLLGVLASLGAPPPPSRGCLVEDFEYRTNQTWYRHIRTPTDTHCVRCTCRSDSQLLHSVHCFDVPCTAAMCQAGKEEECCKVCKVDATQRGVGGGERSPCLHNGKIYQSGDEFSSNVTGLQAQKPNQCIHCMCQSGLVLCRLKTCSPTQCVSQDTNRCCPSCKDEEGSEEEPEMQANPVLVTIMVSDGQSTSGDCSAAGVTYSHGSSWQPVIGPFGPMDCVFCKCQYGKIECSRLKCVPLHELPCSKPIQVLGHCCPECTGESDGVSEEILHHPSISVTLEGGKGVEVSCLPPQTNTLVFRSHAASSSSAYYQYAFQSAAGDRSTRLLTWTVKDGHIGDFSEQHLSKEEFKILMDTFKFKPQGATRTKFMEKFLKKAKKLPEQCGNRCTAKIHRLEQTLHLREVTQRQRSCLPQETSFH